jgi:hypothetical protein
MYSRDMEHRRDVAMQWRLIDLGGHSTRGNQLHDKTLGLATRTRHPYKLLSLAILYIQRICTENI